MTVHPFDDAIRLTPLGGGRFKGRASKAYWNMMGPFGGITAAQALNALMLREDRIGDPLALTVNYCGPVGEGEFEVLTQLQRSNRSTQHWSFEMSQADAQGEARKVLTGTAVFAIRRPVWGASDDRMPEAPAPESLPRTERADVPLPWLERYDFRYVRGEPLRDNPDSRSLFWVSDHPRRPLDFLSLTAICDVFVARVLVMRNQRVPIATVSMNIYFHRAADELAEIGGTPLLADGRARLFHRGFADQEATLWSRDGRLLASSQQICWYKE